MHVSYFWPGSRKRTIAAFFAPFHDRLFSADSKARGESFGGLDDETYSLRFWLIIQAIILVLEY